MTNYKKDKIKGMLMGVILGDVSGSMHEFKNQTKQPYQRIISKYKTSHVKFQFKTLTIEPGIPTDDSEMTLALYESLKSNKFVYNRKKVIMKYMDWANRATSLGRNTRKLLKGVKTVNGYEKRFSKISNDEKKKMQSNGSLMRASPLALLSDIKDAITDCNLTNPTRINREINLIHVNCLKILLENKKKEKVKKFLKKFIASDLNTSKTVETVVKNILKISEKNKVGKEYNETGKGWVVTAFYLAYTAFLNFDNFPDALEWLVTKNPKSDTDTNCAISGSLFGAYLGFEKMKNDPILKKNINFVISQNKNNKNLKLDIIM